jgi:hypothetical protein
VAIPHNVLHGDDSSVTALGPRRAVDGVKSTGFIGLVEACEPLDVGQQMRIFAILG